MHLTGRVAAVEKPLISFSMQSSFSFFNVILRARMCVCVGEVGQCQNGACDLDLDLEMRSKLGGHEISIGTAAFRLTGFLFHYHREEWTGSD